MKDKKYRLRPSHNEEYAILNRWVFRCDVKVKREFVVRRCCGSALQSLWAEQLRFCLLVEAHIWALRPKCCKHSISLVCRVWLTSTALAAVAMASFMLASASWCRRCLHITSVPWFCSSLFWQTWHTVWLLCFFVLQSSTSEELWLA